MLLKLKKNPPNNNKPFYSIIFWVLFVILS